MVYSRSHRFGFHSDEEDEKRVKKRTRKEVQKIDDLPPQHALGDSEDEVKEGPLDLSELQGGSKGRNSGSNGDEDGHGSSAGADSEIGSSSDSDFDSNSSSSSGSSSSSDSSSNSKSPAKKQVIQTLPNTQDRAQNPAPLLPRRMLHSLFKIDNQNDRERSKRLDTKNEIKKHDPGLTALSALETSPEPEQAVTKSIPTRNPILTQVKASSRDTSAAQGSSQRVGWAGGSKIAVPAGSLVQIHSKTFVDEKGDALDLLQAWLEHTDFVPDGEIKLAVASGLTFKNLAQQLVPNSTSHQIFSLGHALFDELEIPEVERDERIVAVERKRQLTGWLSEVILPAAEARCNKTTLASEKIFHLLTAHQILRAVQLASDSGMPRLATLISQTLSRQARADLQTQLEFWIEEKADVLIDKGVRMVYALLAGVPVVHGSNGPIDLMAGLDWRTRFGCSLWWFTPSQESIQDAFAFFSKQEEYNQAMQPPPFAEKGIDAVFRLIQCYCAPSTNTLTSALVAHSYTRSARDDRLPWHIYNLLSRLMRVKDVGDRYDALTMEEVGSGEGNSFVADNLTTSYAAQLESMGLWTWAIYILTHLELPHARARSVQDTLLRNIGNLDDEAMSFLVDRVQMPQSMIYKAQSIFRCSQGNFAGQFESLLKAQAYESAYTVVMDHLVWDKILEPDWKGLQHILQSLSDKNLVDWDLGGGVLLEVAMLSNKRVNIDLLEAETSLQQLLSRINSLCQSRPGLTIRACHEMLCNTIQNIGISLHLDVQIDLQAAERSIDWLDIGTAQLFKRAIAQNS